MSLDKQPRVSDEPDATALPLNGEAVRLFNVKFSPNLGDGLLSEALENGLRDLGADKDRTYSVDLAARTGYGPGSVSRSMLLNTLNTMPPALRHMAIWLPLKLMLHRRWKPHYEAHLDGARAVVIGGGNLFSDMDLNFPSKIAAVLHLAADRRLPTAIYGVGVADGWSSTGIDMMRRALLRARPTYVSVRDEASRQRFDSLFAGACGRPAAVVRDPGVLVSRFVKGADVDEAVRPIGLCVTSPISVRYHSDITTTATELGNWYVELAGRLSGEGRPLLVFTNGSPEDERFLDTIADRLDRAGKGRLRRRSVETPLHLAQMISGLRVLVAHRMHALIAGYSYAVPIFALAWDPKVDAFMASVGAGDRIATATSGTLDRVSDAVRQLLRSSDPSEAERRTAVGDEAFADVAGLASSLRQAIMSSRDLAE